MQRKYCRENKIKKQRLDKIKEKEQNINNKLFKHYFKYQSSSKMYNTSSGTKKHKDIIFKA